MLKRLSLVMLFLMTNLLFAQEAKVTQLMSKDLTDLPNKEGLMVKVEYAPGGSDTYIAIMHTHLFTYWKAQS